MNPIRLAQTSDISSLVELENKLFDSDRLSSRRFRYFIKDEQAELWVLGTPVFAYGLMLYHRGTSLARLYSLAVAPECQGQGIAKMLLQQMEQKVLGRQYLMVRLEVDVNNQAGIGLYRSLGYKTIARLASYYEDGSDGLRMEKRLRPSVKPPERLPYYPQSTSFSCGPAALLMAMSSLDKTIEPDRIQELNLWRESTTIYMTSGHGGTSPQGLAVAAGKRGFDVRLWLSSDEIPFLASVRDAHKREVIELVGQEFNRQCQQLNIERNDFPSSLEPFQQELSQGTRILLLISTYRMNRNKAPHWVWLVQMDEQFAFINDPDTEDQSETDNYFVPVSRENLLRMMQYGAGQYKAAILLRESKTG